jgi:hypothetical protein
MDHRRDRDAPAALGTVPGCASPPWAEGQAAVDLRVGPPGDAGPVVAKPHPVRARRDPQGIRGAPARTADRPAPVPAATTRLTSSIRCERMASLLAAEAGWRPRRRRRRECRVGDLPRCRPVTRVLPRSRQPQEADREARLCSSGTRPSRGGRRARRARGQFGPEPVPRPDLRSRLPGERASATSPRGLAFARFRAMAEIQLSGEGLRATCRRRRQSARNAATTG